jgi:hypothetical protein
LVHFGLEIVIMIKSLFGTVALATLLSFGSTTASAVVGGCPAISIAEANSILNAASKLGDTPAGRRLIADLAFKVQKISSCDVALATKLAELAAASPDWAQVAFGAVLDGTGTASNGRGGRGGRGRGDGGGRDDRGRSGDHDNGNHSGSPS